MSGMEIVPVPVDAEGIVVDAIPADVRLVYVTPSHQSPTGSTMSLPRRRALLEPSRPDLTRRPDQGLAWRATLAAVASRWLRPSSEGPAHVPAPGRPPAGPPVSGSG